MAIARVGNATSLAQTATNTPTLAITATTTGGNQLVMVVASPARTVSTITDQAGNTWRQVARATATGVAVEMWATDTFLANKLTAQTVTVTMSGNGRFACVLAEYSGVATMGGTETLTNTGAASPATTGALSNAESGDMLLSAFCNSAGTAFTATSGAIPTGGQVATTAVSAALLQNTGATTLTDSATYTGTGTFAIVSVDVRALTTNTDMFGTSVSGDFWSDAGTTKQLVGLLTSTHTDKFGTAVSGDNWTDGLSFDLATTLLPLTVSLSDSNLASWSDALAFTYGLIVVSEQLAMGAQPATSDALVIGTGMSVGDNAATWQDTLGLDTGLTLADSFTLSETLAIRVEQRIAAGDDLNVWNEAIRSTIGLNEVVDNANNWQDGYALLLATYTVAELAVIIGGAEVHHVDDAGQIHVRLD